MKEVKAAVKQPSGPQGKLPAFKGISDYVYPIKDHCPNVKTKGYGGPSANVKKK